jgi:hypothetical protein
MAEKGRPSVYSPELAHEICEQLAEGRTLREVCRGEGMPSESIVRKWALDDKEGFFTQYARAREIGYHAMADETLEIADDGSNDWMERSEKRGGGYELNGEHVQRSRLRVDTRKWMLAKALPKIYGERVAHELTGKDGGPIETIALNDTEAAREVSFLLARAVKQKQETAH